MEYAGAAVGSRQDYQSAYTQPSNIAATEIAREHPRGQQKPDNGQHSKQERRAGQIQNIDDGCIQRGKNSVCVLRSMLKIEVGSERRMKSDKSLQCVYLCVVIQPAVSMQDEPNYEQQERHGGVAHEALEGIWAHCAI